MKIKIYYLSYCQTIRSVFEYISPNSICEHVIGPTRCIFWWHISGNSQRLWYTQTLYYIFCSIIAINTTCVFILVRVVVERLYYYTNTYSESAYFISKGFTSLQRIKCLLWSSLDSAFVDNSNSIQGEALYL